MRDVQKQGRVHASSACIDTRPDQPIKKCLEVVQKYLNELPNEAISKSPFELLFRYINRRDKGEGCELTMDIETRYTRPFILREETRARILEEQIKCKKRHGKSRAIHVTFKVEDTICMQENPEQVGYSAKL
ncbi:uncharacterized protein LOC117180167 isoform X1 [Belonocnema kinseyi]|uniref:uncharacterized protein LOC117180167 isoform X1 n=1 Tax=Belonocnema kinseyi TaxID=2817044 RepID=UPI00143D475E|nr:uncharacterized protein LOC117180167 isoform X1 [Belonocnema kinseyi]